MEEFWGSMNTSLLDLNTSFLLVGRLKHWEGCGNSVQPLIPIPTFFSVSSAAEISYKAKFTQSCWGSHTLYPLCTEEFNEMFFQMVHHSSKKWGRWTIWGWNSSVLPTANVQKYALGKLPNRSCKNITVFSSNIFLFFRILKVLLSNLNYKTCNKNSLS